MRKLSKEELENMPIKGAKNASVFYKAIINLRIGEGLFISKKEYNLKQRLSRICRRIMKRFPNVKYVIGELADGTGWMVKRTE